MSDGCGPDYWGLVLRVLPSLRNFGYVCAACPELTISEEEASKIRALGFGAEAGRWKVPRVPFQLVADTSLEYLSVGWDSRKTDAQPIRENGRVPALPPERNGRHPDILPEHLPRDWDTRTQESEDENPRTPTQEPAKFEETLRKVIRVIQTAGGRAQVRRVQQGSWRAVKPFGAPLFRQVLRELLARGVVRMDGNEVVLVAAAVVKQSQDSPPVEPGHRHNPPAFQRIDSPT